MRSGYVNVLVSNGVTSWVVGVNGYDWSRLAVDWNSVTYTSATPSTANRLVFTATTPDPSGTTQRFVGFPLRCLSTAVEGEESVPSFDPTFTKPTF